MDIRPIGEATTAEQAPSTTRRGEEPTVEMMEILAVALGLGVGLSLGALGGGGSTLAVPILVFVAGLSTHDATTASLTVVGAASAIGAWGHYRRGNVRLGAGLAFGAAGIVGARVGTLLNRNLDEHVLLLAFSALIVVVAVRMYRKAGAARSAADAGTGGAGGAGDDAEQIDSGGAAPARVLDRPTTGIELNVASIAKLALAATAVGLLTGLFGVGGGFAVVPALTLLLGFSTRDAIGTSLLVITMNAAIALSMRLGELSLDWTLVLAFLATVTVGVVVGGRMAARIDADRLTRSFAIMLLVVAVYTAGGAVVALA